MGETVVSAGITGSTLTVTTSSGTLNFNLANTPASTQLHVSGSDVIVVPNTVKVWTGASSTDFSNAQNWNDITNSQTPAAAAPGAADIAQFTSGGGTVTGTGTAKALQFGGTGPWTVANGASLSSTDFTDTAGLTIQNGATIRSSGSTVLDASAGAASLTVTDAGSEFITGSSVYVGKLGAGTLSAENGGTALLGPLLYLGNSGISSGTILVDATSVIEVGTAGIGTAGALTVDGSIGGAIQSGNVTGRGVIAGNLVNNGFVQAGDFSGGGTLEVTGAVTGTGELEISAGQSLVSNGTTSVTPGSVLQLDGAVTAGQAVYFSAAPAFGAGPKLRLLDPIEFHGTLTNFGSLGDTLELTGQTVVAASLDFMGLTATLAAGTTLSFAVSTTGPFITGSIPEAAYLKASGSDIIIAPDPIYAWTGSSDSSFGNVLNWDDVTNGVTPAASVPAAGDVAGFGAGGGTITGTGSVEQLRFSGANPWTIAGGATLLAGSSGIVDDGIVQVQGGTLSTTSFIRVGDSGSGWLDIGNLGLVQGGGQLQIADRNGGPGTVSVETGGQLIGGSAFLGHSYFGTVGSGTLLVSGGRAQFSWLDDTNGAVIVNNGGTLINSESFFAAAIISAPAGSASATATIGNGTWIIDGGQLIVGDLGGGSLDIGAGGLVNAATLDIGNQSGGTGTVSVAGAGAMLQAGTLVVANTAGASASLTVGSGGTVSVQRMVVNDRLTLSGGLVSASGSSGNSGTISGFGTFMGQLTDGGQIVVSGGMLEVTGGIDGNGTITIAGGATLKSDDVLGGNQTVEFANSATAASLILGFLQSVNDFTIENWQNGDAILFNNGVTVTGEQWLGGTLAVFTSGGEYDFTHVTLAAGTTPVFSTTANSVELISCFAEGTLTETEHGAVPVEQLREGDVVRTCIAEGGAPVVWLGWREVDCAAHPKPDSVWPVRIAAGAFGPAMPARDLWLSPDHAVFVNDVLIPVKQLINGSTIVQVPRDRVTYYHLELPQHDVVLAEGLPAESYLDVGDRSNFVNGGGPVRLFADFGLAWEGQGAAPLVVTGPELAAVRQALAQQAAALGRQAA